jgi:flagellar basal body-associated protein FliL
VEKPPENSEETKSEIIDTQENGAEHASADAPSKKSNKLYVTPEMKADPLSRKLILYSMAFASLALICIGLLTFVHYQKKRAEHPPVIAEIAHVPEPMITEPIQEIHVVLKNGQDLRVEIVAECSSKDACSFIKTHTAQVRDLLIPILNTIEADQISSLEVKKLIRKKLTDRLNTLEMEGKVIQVHFNNLSVEGKPK